MLVFGGARGVRCDGALFSRNAGYLWRFVFERLYFLSSMWNVAPHDCHRHAFLACLPTSYVYTCSFAICAAMMQVRGKEQGKERAAFGAARSAIPRLTHRMHEY